MSLNLRTARIYHVEYSNKIMCGNDTQRAMFNLFKQFNIHSGAEDEYVHDYEMERSELIRFRDYILNKPKYYQEREMLFYHYCPIKV